MVVVRLLLFGLIIASVKIIFILFFQEGDKKILMMKEASNFIEYLRVYSCSMKMSIHEILKRYNFKFDEVRIIFEKLMTELKNEDYCTNDFYDFSSFIATKLKTPNDFNYKLCVVLEYYGVSTSDVLNKNLALTKTSMEKYIEEYENKYKESKILLNKLSVLVGCLIAIILI